MKKTNFNTIAALVVLLGASALMNESTHAGFLDDITKGLGDVTSLVGGLANDATVLATTGLKVVGQLGEVGMEEVGNVAGEALNTVTAIAPDLAQIAPMLAM